MSVAKTMVINAPASRIWEAIKTNRAGDPSHRHIVCHTSGDYQVEERFDAVPVIGTVHCLYSEYEIEGKRIEYKLISSDKFIAFEGVWELTPCAGGKQTSVTLTSFTDTGMHVPLSLKLLKRVRLNL